MSRQPMPRTPSPRTLLTASLAAQRPADRPGGGGRVALEVAPADAPDAEPQDLADRLLGRPAAGERLGAVADVALLGRRQDAPREAPPEGPERVPEPGRLDGVV